MACSCAVTLNEATYSVPAALHQTGSTTISYLNTTKQVCVLHMHITSSVHTLTTTVYQYSCVVLLLDAHKHCTLLGARKAARNGSLWVFCCNGNDIVVCCCVKWKRLEQIERKWVAPNTLTITGISVQLSISFVALMHSVHYISIVFPTSVARSLNLSWVVG